MHSESTINNCFVNHTSRPRTNNDSGTINSEIRDKMTDYWTEHSSSASLNEMMLDLDAKDLDKVERPEILSYLPDFTGKRVIELGAGIGRFTSVLAESASSVLAVDFIQRFIDKNKDINSRYDNIEYLCTDVSSLHTESNSSDLVFSNWLLMYLEDAEVQELLQKLLEWLDEDGYFFVRESCFHGGGNVPVTTNPTFYRSPLDYEAFFRTAFIPCGDNQSYGLDLVFSKSVDTYIKYKGNSNQVVWLWQKGKRGHFTNHGSKSIQRFLDLQESISNGILGRERIIGRTFVSLGGLETTKYLVSMLDIQSGHVVLDVGCGIGGSDFYMAKNYDCQVVGIDLSSNMIRLGMERAREVGIGPHQVTFEIADATKRIYKPESYDVIYSRDTILHIPDKLALFKRFYKWLKPGGKLLISDYCCSEGEHSDAFKAYVRQRGYNLLTVHKYGKVLEEAGFVNVRAEDKTDLFVEVLTREVKLAEERKEEFIEEFNVKGYGDIVTNWTDKLYRCGRGDQRWGLFYGVKP